MKHCILLLKHLSNHAFYNKRLQTLFKDQLDRSMATCSFNVHLFLLASLNGWCSVETDSYPWIQVNLNARVYIAGLIIHNGRTYYVETYRVTHGYSSSSLTFATTSSGSTQLVSTVKSIITPNHEYVAQELHTLITSC